MTATVKRRVIRAGGWGIIKRIIKPIPIVGSLFAVGLAAYEIRRKGLVPGAIHVGLDATPIVGTTKNLIEIFTGDLIPDKPQNGASEPDKQIGPARTLAIEDPKVKSHSLQQKQEAVE
jgi:hypothetical protein